MKNGIYTGLFALSLLANSPESSVFANSGLEGLLATQKTPTNQQSQKIDLRQAYELLEQLNKGLDAFHDVFALKELYSLSKQVLEMYADTKFPEFENLEKFKVTLHEGRVITIMYFDTASRTEYMFILNVLNPQLAHYLTFNGTIQSKDVKRK